MWTIWMTKRTCTRHQQWNTKSWYDIEWMTGKVLRCIVTNGETLLEGCYKRANPLNVCDIKEVFPVPRLHRTFSLLCGCVPYKPALVWLWTRQPIIRLRTQSYCINFEWMNKRWATLAKWLELGLAFAFVRVSNSAHILWWRPPHLF